MAKTDNQEMRYGACTSKACLSKKEMLYRLQRTLQDLSIRALCYNFDERLLFVRDKDDVGEDRNGIDDCTIYDMKFVFDSYSKPVGVIFSIETTFGNFYVNTAELRASYEGANLDLPIELCAEITVCIYDAVWVINAFIRQ